MQCQVFSEVTSSVPAPQGKGKYQLDSRDGEAEHYELEPLASSQKSEDKPREEQEMGAQLYNGVPAHPHTGPFPHIQYTSKAEPGRTGPENGLAAALRPPSRTLPAHVGTLPLLTTCPSNGPPTPVLSPPGAPSHPSALPPLRKHPSKQNAAHLDPVYTHMDCHMHYVHCPPAHFHHCAQGRVVAPRQGPAHTCNLRKYCVHAAGQQKATALTQEPGSEPGGPGNYKHETRSSSPDSSQNISPPAVTQCPSPSPDSPLSQEKQKGRDSDHCCGDNHTSTTDTTTPVDACCKVPGNQEQLRSIPVTREESRKKCKRSSKRQRASSASPKKLYCFNRTLKVKCNSASEFNVPKTDTSVPPIAINTNPSSESLC
ncbi:hypothetical protein F7725_019241 [Dissostichus mawsoni]|uniref:Uncharacterized protein n=1 Tax=Dissostichus mawsoni TaxID=36200 RepID=A0A7J5YJ60_DISMA|nr:hypothetical protein F7725_019241 [Dissostichus mawsoni]